MGPKRSHGTMEGKEAQATSPFMPMFEWFRSELDEHHDRRERIIKASRDITAASKKVIFTLQRIRELGRQLPPHVIKGNQQYYGTISTQFSSVAPDVQNLNTWRYARQISGGCQEYIEAASFEHYLTTASLLTYDRAAERVRRLVAEGGEGVALSMEDYILGIYDMTGELMRFAITAMATGGSLPAPPATADDKGDGVDSDVAMGGGAEDGTPTFRRNVLTDMRLLRAALESIDPGQGPFAKEVDKKLDVMRASVEKVEKALYGLVVRGAERPKGWMPDADGSARPAEIEV